MRLSYPLSDQFDRFSFRVILWRFFWKAENQDLRYEAVSTVESPCSSRRRSEFTSSSCYTRLTRVESSTSVAKLK